VTLNLDSHGSNVRSEFLECNTEITNFLIWVAIVY